MIASIARSASVSSSSPTFASGPAAAASRRGCRARGRRAPRARARSRSGSVRATSAMNRSAARGGIRSPRLTSAADSPARGAARRERLAQTRGHQVGQHRPAARPARAARVRTGGLARVAARRARRRASRRGAARECAAPSSRSSSALSRARARQFQRELLELAQQPLLALADLRRPARVAAAMSSSRPMRAACARAHLGRSHCLTVACATIAPGPLDRLVQRRRRLRAALLAREERDGRVRRHRRERRHEACSTSACFQRSTPSTKITRRPDRRASSPPAPPRRPLGWPPRPPAPRRCPAAIAFGQRAQPRAPLGDGAVVVAVDQIRGLELGHRRQSRRQQRRDTHFAPSRSRGKRYQDARSVACWPKRGCERSECLRLRYACWPIGDPIDRRSVRTP